jgi:2-methylcitrate dehydratase PrpD
VIGRAEALPPATTAFINSALMHTMDYDDIHDVARIHPSSVTLPAALAAAELAGATDRELVDAVAVTNEIMCRFGAFVKPLGSGPGAYWLLTQLFGYFGACIAASLVLKLNRDEIVSGLSLAYMQAAGGKETAFGIGGNTRGIYTGFAAQGGVQAALLARAGMKGPDSVMDGKAGLMSLYLGLQPTRDDLAVLTDPEPWVWADTLLKPWPCCRSSHPFVSVSMTLNKRLNGALPKRVLVAVNARSGLLCYPEKERRRPATLADAKYSVPFMVAFTLVKGKVNLLNLNVDALKDATVLAVADCVEVEDRLPDVSGPTPAEITVEMKDGMTFTEKLSGPLGLDDAETREKFETCLTYADRSELIEPLWRHVQEMDGAPIQELTALLRQGARAS